MRESRLSLLLIISLSILIICFLALGIWGYQFYNKVDRIVMKPVIQKTDPIYQDSLLKIYTHTIKSLEEKLGTTYDNAGALEDTLNVRLNDYYRLKAEVSGMLTNPKSDQDFSNANSKIQELQTAMEALRKTNADVTEENKRLYQVLASMKNSSNQNKKVVVSTTPKSLIPKKKVSPKYVSNIPYSAPVKPISTGTQTSTPAPITTAKQIVKKNPEILISNINLERSFGNKEGKNEIVGSFAVKSISANNNPTDIIVVVSQPDGKVIQKSNWESGSFNSSEGKKIYSCKFKIEGSNKEPKKIKFSLPTNESLQGNYTIQVYHDGDKIATGLSH